MHEDEFDGISKEPLTHWRDHITDLEIRTINEFFESVLREYGFEYLDSDVSMFRRLHPSEWNPLTYLANRVILRWGVKNPETF